MGGRLPSQGKARAPKRGWRPLSGRFPPSPGRLAFPSRTPGEDGRRGALPARPGAVCSPPRREVALHLALLVAAAAGAALDKGFCFGLTSPTPRPPAPAGGRGGLDTGRPAHVKCLHQATGSCGARGIEEESALPIEAIASRRLFRPIGAQPHRLIERVSGRVSDPLGNSHQARASRARPPCSRASPSDRALPPPSMRPPNMRARTGCERSNTPCRC
jgi:hypothetical protein